MEMAKIEKREGQRIGHTCVGHTCVSRAFSCARRLTCSSGLSTVMMPPFAPSLNLFIVSSSPSLIFRAPRGRACTRSPSSRRILEHMGRTRSRPTLRPRSWGKRCSWTSLTTLRTSPRNRACRRKRRPGLTSLGGIQRSRRRRGKARRMRRGGCMSREECAHAHGCDGGKRGCFFGARGGTGGVHYDGPA